MSDRSTSTSPDSSNTRYAGCVSATSARASTDSYSSAGVYTSPYPWRSNTLRRVSVIARTSRVSSGSTSRVPLGIGWIITTPRLRVNGLCGHPLDARAELAQALVDALVAAIDLADVADLTASVGAKRGQQHRHAGPDVR